jgi:hypothetical protein
MKLPFELGVKFIFRLVAPGFVLSLGMYPLLAGIRDASGVTAPIQYIFIVSTLVAGWLIVLLDQPIYMLFEGRRFWPSWLWKFFHLIEHQRLAELLRIEDETYKLSQIGTESKKRLFTKRNLESWVRIRAFPFDEQGKYQAQFPTRLGNLLTAFETYPDIRYGMDGVFYWSRIWLRLDKDLREELDTKQAVADSGIYLSLVLYLNAAIWAIYCSGYIQQTTVNDHLPRIIHPAILAISFFLAAYIVYRLSLYAQAQYGEAFKAVIDDNERKIDVSSVVKTVADIVVDSSILNLNRRQQYLIAWRYLHNYRVRCTRPECVQRDPMSPEGFKEHYGSCHPPQKPKEKNDGGHQRDITPDHKQEVQSGLQK